MAIEVLESKQNGERSDLLLIVEDDTTFRDTLFRSLKRRGLNVVAVGTLKAALEICDRESPGRVLLDLNLGTESGLEFLKAIKNRENIPEVVVLTGFGSIATAIDAVKLGARNYLTKPAHLDEILGAFSGEALKRKTSKVPTLDRVEWEHIQRVLSECDGNITKAAKLLRIHRRSLQRKLAKPPAN